MKFGEKYELLESLTTGAVETFIANDKVRGERVLVHILHGDPQKPNQPTVQWVLDSFRRVAPEPVGLVLEAGRYSGTLYAYLVTKLPEETALRAWVKQYKAQARDTQEIPVPPAPPTPESRAATADMAPKDLPQRPVSVTPAPVPPVSVPPVSLPPASVLPVSASPVSVTQLLRDFDPHAKSAAPSAPLREVEPYSIPVPPRPLPPISSAGGQSGLHSAPPWAPEAVRTPAPPKTDPNAGGSAESFRPDFAARNFPSSVAPPPPNEGPKLGEFTSFFQGPFRGDVPSETPAVTPRQEAPQKAVGDFTSVFGSAKPQKNEEPLPAPGIAGNEPAGSFTGWFTPEISPRMSSTTSPPGLPRANPNPAPGLSASPLPASGLHAPDLAESALPASSFPAAPKDPFPPPKPAPYVAPAPPIFPIPVPSNPPIPRPSSAAPSGLDSDGATGAFSRPVIESAPTPQEVPSGPSSYTRIISARPANPAGDDAGANAPAKAAGSPAFAMPALAVPAMAPPPLPPPPLAPKPAFAAPAAPKMPAAPKLPAAPKAPKLEAAAPPPVSYWPLILILTVLFFAALLLVLYFVLKH
jgi:hypothetical protein